MRDLLALSATAPKENEGSVANDLVSQILSFDYEERTYHLATLKRRYPR